MVRFTDLMYEDECPGDKYIVSHRLAAGAAVATVGQRECWTASVLCLCVCGADTVPHTHTHYRRNSKSENRTIKFIKKVLCYYRKYFIHITCTKLVHYYLFGRAYVFVWRYGLYISFIHSSHHPNALSFTACLAANLFAFSTLRTTFSVLLFSVGCLPDALFLP